MIFYAPNNFLLSAWSNLEDNDKQMFQPFAPPSLMNVDFLFLDKFDECGQ